MKTITLVVKEIFDDKIVSTEKTFTENELNILNSDEKKNLLDDTLDNLNRELIHITSRF